MRPDINFTPKMTPNGRPCTPSKYFNHAGTRWGALIFGKSGGGRSNFKILWLDHEIPKFLQDFLSIAIRVKIGFRTLPESSNILVGVTPPHLAATAKSDLAGAWLLYDRRKAYLGMPTDRSSKKFSCFHVTVEHCTINLCQTITYFLNASL